MTDTAKDPTAWWGRFSFALNQSRTWHLAGLELAATRASREWRFQTHRLPDQHEDVHHWQMQNGSLPEETPVSRYFFTTTGDTLYMLPRLADRSVVIKPVNPLFIPAGQEATLFVSTPVWVACYAEQFETPLLDMPVVRPSDTWFGRNTVQGEVCYTTRVLGRTDLNQLPPRAFRVVTPVTVVNSGTTMLPVERINMPTPYLPVYAAENGRLWTPSLHVLKEPGASPPRIRIETTLSPLAGPVELLTPPRLAGSDHTLIRIFDNFF
jgi:hypothetical protein